MALTTLESVKTTTANVGICIFVRFINKYNFK